MKFWKSLSEDLRLVIGLAVFGFILPPLWAVLLGVLCDMRADRRARESRPS